MAGAGAGRVAPSQKVGQDRPERLPEGVWAPGAGLPAPLPTSLPGRVPDGWRCCSAAKRCCGACILPAWHGCTSQQPPSPATLLSPTAACLPARPQGAWAASGSSRPLPHLPAWHGGHSPACLAWGALSCLPRLLLAAGSSLDSRCEGNAALPSASLPARLPAFPLCAALTASPSASMAARTAPPSCTCCGLSWSATAQVGKGGQGRRHGGTVLWGPYDGWQGPAQ